MKHILLVALMLSLVLNPIASAAMSGGGSPKPIRKVDDIFVVGDTPTSKKDIKNILKNCGDPKVVGLLRKGEVEKGVGILLLLGGSIVGIVGITMDSEPTNAYTVYGPVYVNKGTNDGVPYVVAGLAATTVGLIVMVLGVRQEKKAIKVYNEQIASATQSTLQIRSSTSRICLELSW